jgi:hypothetical protein
MNKYVVIKTKADRFVIVRFEFEEDGEFNVFAKEIEEEEYTYILNAYSFNSSMIEMAVRVGRDYLYNRYPVEDHVIVGAL